MKEEWKGAELRERAREIRGSVMPKSITPEMVGGTLEGLAAAVDEVVETLGEIPREHVRVKVRATDDGVTEVETAGGIVRLDVFAVGGFPCYALPRQELTVGADGTVEFDVPWGCKYAVSSHVEGLGASFQLVFDAVAESRDVKLWNFPIGVWALGHTDIGLAADEEEGRPSESWYAIPFITERFTDDLTEYDDARLWAVDEDRGEWEEGSWYIGILVSTVDSTFAISQMNKAENVMTWCDSRDRNTVFPLMDYAGIDRNSADFDWGVAYEKARNDFDGNMNTAKLLAASPNHTAARYCAAMEADYDEVRWLPSAGQLYLMTLNANAINELMDQGMSFGMDFQKLPYRNGKTWVFPCGDQYWWSSSVMDKLCSWVVNCYGYFYYYDRDYSDDVRAVSAFHFEY